MRLTLNCDVGEGLPSDSLVIPFVDLANVACGGHAGGEEQIRQTLSAAKKCGVSVGAHPGYPDPENFGRNSMDLTDAELKKTLAEQLQRFGKIADEFGLTASHVKAHGALYNDLGKKAGLFESFCDAVQAFSPSVPLMLPLSDARSFLKKEAEKRALPVIWEIFADRAYEADGSLRSRKLAGAVKDSPEKIIEQCLLAVEKNAVPIFGGGFYDVSGASSICIHGDNPASVEAARQLRSLLNR